MCNALHVHRTVTVEVKCKINVPDHCLCGKKALYPGDLVDVLVDGHPLVPGPQHVVQVSRCGLATEESGAWWADFTLLEMSIVHLETSARSQSAPCDRGIQQNAEMI